MSNASRVLSPELRNKIMSAEEAAALIHTGVNVGMSGFTGAGYPKAVPHALARQIMDAKLAGEKFPHQRLDRRLDRTPSSTAPWPWWTASSFAFPISPIRRRMSGHERNDRGRHLRQRELDAHHGDEGSRNGIGGSGDFARNGIPVVSS